MTILEEEDWWAILHATTDDLSKAIRTGVLKPPLHILITDGHDDTVAEFEVTVGTDGTARFVPFSSPDISLTETIFPITYKVTGHDGEVMEAAISQELGSKLRRRVS